MKEFGYQRSAQVRDALTQVANTPGAKFLGGGTNLVDLMKNEIETPTTVVDVRHLPLNGIRSTADGKLVIGATTSNSDAAAHPDVRRRYPAVTQAILAGASGQLRNMATIGGNLLQRTRCAYFTDTLQPCNKRVPGSGCPAITGVHHNHAILDWTDHCAATNPGDMGVALTAFDAVVRFQTLNGSGEIPLTDFYRPVGTTPHLETNLPPGALITEIALPRLDVATRSRYRKVRERASYAFATVSIAAALTVHKRRVQDVRIALGGVAARRRRTA